MGYDKTERNFGCLFKQSKRELFSMFLFIACVCTPDKKYCVGKKATLIIFQQNFSYSLSAFFSFPVFVVGIFLCVISLSCSPLSRFTYLGLIKHVRGALVVHMGVLIYSTQQPSLGLARLPCRLFVLLCFCLVPRALLHIITLGLVSYTFCFFQSSSSFF